MAEYDFFIIQVAQRRDNHKTSWRILLCKGRLFWQNDALFSINNGDWKYFYGKKFDFAFVDYRIIATFEPFSVC